MVYFKDGNDGTSLWFIIYRILKIGTSYDKALLIYKDISVYNFEPNITLNDFIKIDDERLVFISTIDFTTLYILVFDLYNSYTNVKIRVYNYTLSNYKIVKELSLFAFNNYLVFTSTVESSLSSTNPFSIFMIFSYIGENNIDIIDEISLYLTDNDNYDSNNNIITKLLEGLIIDNNIFGYIPSNQIKLISIPNQIIFYNGNETTPLSEGNILEFNYRFEQNKESIKNSNDFYSFDYQYIIQEPDYITFYNYAHDVIHYPYNSDESSNFEQKKYYGKTNTVKFKLCHRYCDTCKTLGTSDDDQQCLTCLPLYQYDYFKEYSQNCIPEGYFYDKEERKLIQCTDSNSKYYINRENNKKICFKITYDCPNDYPYLNISNNQCQNYFPPTSIITNIPTTTTTTIPT